MSNTKGFSSQTVEHFDGVKTIVIEIRTFYVHKKKKNILFVTLDFYFFSRYLITNSLLVKLV